MAGSATIPRLSLVIAVTAVAVCAVGAAAWFASPSPSALARRVHAPASLAGIPPILREAVVATEDERFYRHHGIDLIGVLRALPYDVTHLSFAQGASTITEQVAKIVYLGGNDHSLWRKLEDAALAVKLENRYSKETILGAYLSSAYLGEGAVGVRAASERYFGIPAQKLDTARASLLAGLIQAPSLYDPLRNPSLARTRQIAVLRSLVRNGFLTGGEAAAVLIRPLRLRGGRVLPAVTGVDLSPGPAFVWWQLGLGAAIVLLGILAAILTLTPGLRRFPGMLAVRSLALVLFVMGAAAIVRSFRSA